MEAVPVEAVEAVAQARVRPAARGTELMPPAMEERRG